MAFVSNSGITATNTLTPGSPEHLVISHEDVAHSLILCELPDADGYSAEMQSTVKPNGRTLASSLRLNGLFDGNRRVWNCSFVVTEQQMKLFELLVAKQQETRKPCSIVDFAVQAQNAQTYAIAPVADSLGITAGWGAYNAWIDTDLGYRSPYNGHVWWLLQFQAESIDTDTSSSTTAPVPVAQDDLLYLTDRANHTGTQLASTISDFDTAAALAAVDALEAGTNISLDKTVAGKVTISSTATGVTDLNHTTDTETVTVTSSTGANTAIPAATTSDAGVMTAADRATLDNLNETITDAIGATLVQGAGISLSFDDANNALTISSTVTAPGTDLDNVPAADSIVISSSTGNNTTIPAATATSAGIFTAANFTALAGATDRANHTGTQSIATLSDFGTGVANVTVSYLQAGTGITFDQGPGNSSLTINSTGATDLATTATGSAVTVTNTTGTDATIPAATTTEAGVLTAADKSKLDSLDQAFLLDRSNHTGDWIEMEVLTLGTGASNFGSSYEDPGVWRRGTTVWLQGAISPPGALNVGTVLATLPTGYRPTGLLRVSTPDAQLLIRPNGDIEWFSPNPVPIPAPDFVSLSGLSFVTDGVVSVTNNPPTATSPQAFSAPDGATAGTVLGTVAASDPDVGDTLTYSINGGSTQWAINSSTGELSALVDVDSANGTPQQITVNVSDGSETAQVTVDITISTVVNEMLYDVSANPEILKRNPGSFSVNAYSEGDFLQYTFKNNLPVSGTDNGVFEEQHLFRVFNNGFFLSYEHVSGTSQAIDGPPSFASAEGFNHTWEHHQNVADQNSTNNIIDIYRPVPDTFSPLSPNISVRAWQKIN